MSPSVRRPHRLRLLTAWAALCAALTVLTLCPADSERNRGEAVRSRYAGWSGVLRLWTCEGWPSGSGSLSLWLGDRIAAFERAHDGVYIQPTDVGPETLADFVSADLPPDLLLFYPGLLTSTVGLLPLAAPLSLRGGLEQTGCVEGIRYAAPVAMGAYGFAYSRLLLRSLPADWSALEPERLLPASPKQKSPFWLNCPADSPALCWSAALIALLSGTSEERLAADEPLAGEGLDLGLPEDTAPPPEKAPPVRLIQNALPRVLPDSFRRGASVYSDFIGGLAAAIPATPREIRRLELLADSGKAPDWAFGVSGAPFTDQLALLAATDCPHTSLEDRQALCREFIAFLLTEDSQAALVKARALPVTETAPLYAAQTPMGLLENVLADQTLAAAPAFENGWRAEAAALAERMTAGTLTPGEAMDALKALLSAP